jgi:hypothetical protein
MSTEQNRKIVFAPGCFDDFEGTQAELDAFMAEIVEMLTDADENGQVALSDNFMAVPHIYDDEDEEEVAAVEALTAQLNAARKRMLN